MGCVSRVLEDVKALDKLLKHGFRDAALKSGYEKRRLAGSCVVVLYSSGKLVIQGNDDAVSKVDRMIFGKKERFDDSSLVRIGGDECLKGDTFGGLVVSCIKADAKVRRQLSSLGVTDSKRISDARIRLMGGQVLRALGKENVSFVEVYPDEYNRMYFRCGSVTRMLNAMYMRAIGELGDFDECVVDRYPGLRIGNCSSVEKGESKYIEIAAASVVARYRGLMQLDCISKRAGFEIPKGSTHVMWALERLKREKRNLGEFAKMHFKNVSRFLEDE